MELMEQRANHKSPSHYIACGGEEKIHGKTGGTDISAGKHAARDEKHIGFTVLITKNYKSSYRQPAGQCFSADCIYTQSKPYGKAYTPVGTYSSEKYNPGIQ